MEVQRRNKILVNKMSSIIRGRSTLKNGEQQQSLNGGAANLYRSSLTILIGDADALKRSNKAVPMNFVPAAAIAGATAAVSQPRIQIQSMKETKSYKQTQKHLASENQRLLKRLQDKRSVYDVDRWNKQREHIEKVIGLRT